MDSVQREQAERLAQESYREHRFGETLADAKPVPPEASTGEGKETGE